MLLKCCITFLFLFFLTLFTKKELCFSMNILTYDLEFFLIMAQNNPLLFGIFMGTDKKKSKRNEPRLDIGSRRARSGLEPGTSRTLSENNTTRPTSLVWKRSERNNKEKILFHVTRSWNVLSSRCSFCNINGGFFSLTIKATTFD